MGVRDLKAIQTGVNDYFKNLLLPVDYPDSVTKEYMKFTFYWTISATSLVTMMFLST